MKRHSVLIIAFAFFIGVTAWVGAALSQAPAPARGQQPPAAPAGGGQRGAPGTENGIAVFQTQCMSCHGNPKAEKAPSPAAIRLLSPERIYDSLMTGTMKDQGAKLSDADRRGVSEFMAGRPLGSSKVGDAKNMQNQCRTNPLMSDPARGAAWNGWGVGFVLQAGHGSH